MTALPASLHDSFNIRDNPTPEFIQAVRDRFPVEREVDELLTRKMQNRSGPPYRRITLDELRATLTRMLTDLGVGNFVITEPGWFTGGVSKIQMGFTLEWDDPAQGRRKERLVLRMDPSEGSNTTSRPREYELLEAFQGIIPVPAVYWLDPDGRWFPQPALIYAFAPGVTKSPTTQTGQVSGLGTNFGPDLRAKLAPQFMAHLAAIHHFDFSARSFATMDMPQAGTTQAALWQLNRARRIWEEDRGEDFPLMDVAANWLESNAPPLDHASIVHGDFRSGNFLFDEDTGQISAWLDWERAHIGDRHRDLAWMTQSTMGHYSEDGKTYFVCGLIPLDEFFEEYTRASGLSVDPDRLAWYRILNCYQIIASTVATANRVARLGKSHQDPLLIRVKGMAPTVERELSLCLKERL
ncbi:MAG TPA: phosphotransferase family protein [Paracoccus solventivorans]|uniref:Phosphotransferase family protein n=1 Tax=Paracoccus solventivorans TaxID=53463 RepID=A0A832QX30_9RHOB|nr:phosphotransferase family protein [Paracoccus solventivorans]HHW32913.1 phosphotransferase family protein [Paracoccus solventivorans]